MLRTNRSAFTLIELLVVISIIALLIGILLPALGVARDTARGNACLANILSMGQALNMYAAESKGFFMGGYQYRAANDFNNVAISNTNSVGYLQWSGVLVQGGFLGETWDGNSFACPSHKAPNAPGWAPTNFISAGSATTTNTPSALNPSRGGPLGQTGQFAGVVDTQALYLSYVANEAIMGRTKTSNILNSGGMKLVRPDDVDKASSTVHIAEYTDNSLAIQGSSVSGSFAYKTHRPFNAVQIDQAGTAAGAASFDGEKVALGTQILANDSNGNPKLWANEASKLQTGGSLSATVGFDSVDNTKTGSTSNNDEHAHHIVYLNTTRHSGGANYTYVDGHAAVQKLSAVLDPSNFQMGRRFYSLSKAPIVFDPVSNNPVN
jgi:prepilin-type processing-associated H-X9-DG protein/prepilin-type N-terminal cleavage/methylation domain-containing protein